MSQNMASHEQFFRLVAERLHAHWEPLATHLGLSNDRITSIKQDQPDTEEQIFVMLMTWKQSNQPGNAILQTLARALGNCGRRDMEAEILQGTFLRPEDSPQSPKSTSGKLVTIPDVLTEVKLRKLSDHLAGEWQSLATFLGVSSEMVGKIRRDYRGIQEQVFQMLMKWKNAQTHKDPLGCLVTALRDVGRRDLAEQLMFDAI